MLHYPTFELVANFYLVGISYILYNLIGYKLFGIPIKEISVGFLPIVRKQKNELRLSWGPLGILGNVGSKHYKDGFPKQVILAMIVLSSLPFIVLMSLLFLKESCVEITLVSIKAAVFLEDAKAVIQVAQASSLSFLSLTYLIFFSIMSVFLLPKIAQMLFKEESKIGMRFSMVYMLATLIISFTFPIRLLWNTDQPLQIILTFILIEIAIGFVVAGVLKGTGFEPIPEENITETENEEAKEEGNKDE